MEVNKADTTYRVSPFGRKFPVIQRMLYQENTEDPGYTRIIETRIDNRWPSYRVDEVISNPEDYNQMSGTGNDYTRGFQYLINKDYRQRYNNYMQLMNSAYKKQGGSLKRI